MDPDKAKPFARGGAESGGSSEKIAELPKENPLSCSALLFDLKGDERTEECAQKEGG
jgi:hypothetical protein